jgi:hypothetical protein
LLQAAQFDSENCFAAGATISAAKATSLQPMRFSATNANSLEKNQFRQRSPISLKTTQLWQRMLICCRTDNSKAFANSLKNSVLAVNQNFAADKTTSAVNHNSMQTTQFRQRIKISL